MSDYYVYNGRLYSSDELRHHGILGMKWGVRRYQNPDGSLTPEGKRHQKQLQDQLESGGVSKNQLISELKESGKENWNNQLNKSINDINSSDYAKRYQQAVATSAALDNEAMTTNASLGFGAIPMGRGAGNVAIRQKEFQDYADKYLSEHIDDFADAALKDLGYDTTEKGRKYLKSLRIIDWEV